MVGAAAGEEPPAPRQVADLVTEAVPRTSLRGFGSSFGPFRYAVAGGRLLYFVDDGARGSPNNLELAVPRG